MRTERIDVDHCLRIAVVGLGRIAWQYHLSAIQQHAGFRLCGVVDPLPARLAEAETKFGISAGYATLAELLERERPELVVIASPTCFHAEQAGAAFAAGADVICEKPLGCTLAEAEAMIEAGRRQGRRMVVYQPHRFRPETAGLREILASGVLGEIYHVRRTWNHFSRRDDWQSLAANGGGMLNNYGSHFLDQFLCVFGGRFERLQAELRQVVGGGDAEDFVRIFGVNGAGIVFDLEINMGSAFETHEWVVYGRNGTARCEAEAWHLRYLDPRRLKKLEIQAGFAAADRKYPREADLPWQEERCPFPAVAPEIFYDRGHDYFTGRGPTPVPLAESCEVMRLLESCRGIGQEVGR